MQSQNHGTTGLSSSHKADYDRNGFVFPIDVLTPTEAATARAELERIEHAWLDNGLPLALNQYKRVNAQVVMPLAARLALDPRILDAVEGILGPDLMIWSAEFFIKQPNTQHIVSMHQDLTYWGLGATDHQVTAWLALSSATVASGCMDFVGASHKNPILHKDTYSDLNLLSRGQEVQVDVRPEDKTAIELKPGQMSLHHGLTIHGSSPNQSDDRRIGFAIRYINPNARQEVADRDYALMATSSITQRQNSCFQRPVWPYMTGFAPIRPKRWQQVLQLTCRFMPNPPRARPATDPTPERPRSFRRRARGPSPVPIF